MANILITGSAGFIGFHLSKRLLENGHYVLGIDNLNNYYNPILKEKRNEILKNFENYNFHKIDIANYEELVNLIKGYDVDIIVHLAAQAGVRYSLINPWRYVNSNVLGTLNIFEIARRFNVKKIVYASSSSVYGENKKIPFSEDDRVDQPISLYAATKRSIELMAYKYSKVYGLKAVGLRFFTVYGEYGRPDMALWKFTKNILLGKPIDVYNFGNMERDFTYISDVIDGTISAIDKSFDYEIFNLGNEKPVKLSYFIELIENYLGIEAKKNFLPMQPGDIQKTYADLSKAKKLLGYEPKISIEEGIKRFIDWFKKNKSWTLLI